MLPPEGFDADTLETWPKVVGRLEYVDGRLLFMPPCGDFQQDTVTDVVITLGAWVRRHREFVLGTNEAGMRLGDATRAADAAIWRRSDLGAYDGGLRRVPPVLAVEVAGADGGDSEEALREKAKWGIAREAQKRMSDDPKKKENAEKEIAYLGPWQKLFPILGWTQRVVPLRQGRGFFDVE